MSNTTNLQVTYRNVADIAAAMQKFQENAMPSIGEYQQILTNIKNSKIDGQTNINIRNYFADVHYLINDTILTTFDAITSIITLYAYDLEKYDGSKDFIVIQSELEKKYPKYQHISDTFSSNHVIIKSAYDSISEYIDEGLLDVSNITSRLEDMHVFFETMYQQIYDEGSSYGDKLIEINELLTNLQKVIDKAMEIKITEYDFSQLSTIEGINELNDSLFNIQSFFSNDQLMEKLDEAAYSLEAYKRLKDAEAKRKSLIIDIAIAVAVAVGSVAVVAATGGLAAGIIATGLAVTSAVDVGFKVSEVVENESVIHKSRENDMSPGFNPIRDKLFNENQEAYDKIKSLNSTALGFFQFATIFVGGVGLIDGWKSASTVAQKGLAVLKAGGRAGLKIGREYAENYVEDKVAGFLSSISSYVLMQQGYSSEAAQHIGDKRANVLMSLYGLGGSVKGAVGGVKQYKQAKRDRAVIGDKEIIGKANSIRRNDDIEITPRKKYDTSNCEYLRKRLANTKNDSNPKNKVNKAKTDVDKKHNKGNVQHRHSEVTNSRTPDIDTNTKHKNDIKNNKSHDIDSKKASDAVKMQQEKIDTALEVVKIQEMHTWTDFYKANGGPGTKDLSRQDTIKKHLEQKGNTARVETTRDGHIKISLLDSNGKKVRALEGKYSGIEIGGDIDLKNYDRAITKEHLDKKDNYAYEDVVYTKDGDDYLHENAKYYDKDNGMLYTTNEYGHIDMAVMTRDLAVPDMNDPKIKGLNARDPKAAKDVVDKNHDDIGFHLLAKMLGGKGGIQNMISGDYTLNNTTWKSMESNLNKISKGDKVRFKMQPIYNNKKSSHPDKIIFECWVNGNKEIYEFKNGGQNV